MILIILLMLLIAAMLWDCAAGVIVWGVQFTILNLTERRMRVLRWVLPVVAVLLLRWGGTGGLPWLGEALAGIVFVGWALAWAVYEFVCGGDRGERTGPRP